VEPLPDLTAERVFNLNPKIRWAGLATDRGEVIFSKMRPGVGSFSPEVFDQAFMQLGPLILRGVCERLGPWAGPLETVTSFYEKMILIVTSIRKDCLALTINRENAAILPQLISDLSKLKP
jgi:hypothetical protein